MFPEYPDRKYGGSTARRKKKLNALLEYYRNRPKRVVAGLSVPVHSAGPQLAETVVAATEKAQPVLQQPLPAAAEVVAEPPPVAEAAPLPKKKILPGRSAIGSLLKEVNDQIQVRPDETQKTELTAETLPELWKTFLEEIRHKAQSSFMTVAESQEPVLREETIIFTVQNHISQEMLQLHKNEIASFFIARTTARVQLEFQQTRKAEPGRVIRSPKERLREMAANNDAVNKLIQKFDLNLD